MATDTEAQQQAALMLETVELMVDDVPEVAEDWGEIPWGEAATDEQLSWSMDWSDEMAKLESVAQYAADGLLTAEQKLQYERIIHKLKAVLPDIDRLNLRRPLIPLGA